MSLAREGSGLLADGDHREADRRAGEPLDQAEGGDEEVEGLEQPRREEPPPEDLPGEDPSGNPEQVQVAGLDDTESRLPDPSGEQPAGVPPVVPQGLVEGGEEGRQGGDEQDEAPSRLEDVVEVPKGPPIVLDVYVAIM